MGYISPLSMSISASISLILRYVIALLAIAFYTLIERKFLGYFQTRKGPNKPGLLGLPVPFADAIKLFLKEQTKPTISNTTPFILAPRLRLFLALILWTLFPHASQSFFISFGILFFLCVSRTSIYATFIGGWCSNSKYALLGALRGIAQTISYEVRISLILITAILTLNRLDILLISLNQKSWFLLLIPLITTLWFITNLAETNRTPFDFAEGESELVSGFNIEYRRGLFALIFIAEYTSILAIRILTAALFSGHYDNCLISSSILLLKTLLLATLFIWIRATLPRIRYDHLIHLTWKRFLPLTLSTLLLITPLILILA